MNRRAKIKLKKRFFSYLRQYNVPEKVIQRIVEDIEVYLIEVNSYIARLELKIKFMKEKK